MSNCLEILTIRQTRIRQLGLSIMTASFMASLCANHSALAMQPPANELDELSALNTPAPQTEPLSELDTLSLGSKDPFGTIIIEKKREPVTVTIRALDKIIARTIDLEVPMNEVVKFGSLEILPRYCDKRPPEDFPETTAFLEIFDKRPLAKTPADQQSTDPQTTPQAEPSSQPTILANADENGASRKLIIEGSSIFTGWMFASSPGLNALEHGVYDVWVIDCKTQLVDTETADAFSDSLNSPVNSAPEPVLTPPPAASETPEDDNADGPDDTFDLDKVLDTLPADILPEKTPG